jgi:AcrR family transcriptional regulator
VASTTSTRKKAPRRKRNPRGEGERLRASLIEAAGELLLEHGDADGLSIRAVTARAGVSPTALYLQFAGMEELLLAVSDEAFEDLGGYMRTALQSAGENPRARLQAIGEAYVRFAEQRPGHYRILFATPGREGQLENLRAQDDGVGKEVFGLLLACTADCLPQGSDPRPVALQLWTTLHGYVSLREVMPGFDWPDVTEFVLECHAAHFGAPPDR